MLVKFQTENKDGSISNVSGRAKLPVITKTYTKYRNTLIENEGESHYVKTPYFSHSITHNVFMYGPESDRLAEILNIPPGFKSANGWRLSKNKYKKACRFINGIKK